MDVPWTQVLLVLVLVVVNAVLAGSEIALVSLRDSQVARLEERGGAGRALARLAREPNRFLATIQIGITLAGFLASATAAVAFAELLVEPLEPLVGAAARPLAVVVVTLALTYLTLVLGELAPKRVALQAGERWGLVVARPLEAFAKLTRPAVWLLSHSTDVVVRLLGMDPHAAREQVSEAELRDMVQTQPELTEHERHLIDGAFEFADRTLRQIVTPRPDVLALPHDTDVRTAARRLASSGHTRAPVVKVNLDDVHGTVHLRDLVDAEGTVGEHLQPAVMLPETVACLDALRRLQAARQQMAIVVDEHGGTTGIVTVEDLLEELVGEIYDEADPDVQSVVRHEGGVLTVAGRYPIHDLDDIGVTLPAGDYTTVAGLVLAELGHIPTPGEAVEVAGWRLEVLEASARTVHEVRLVPVTAPTEEAQEEDGA